MSHEKFIMMCEQIVRERIEKPYGLNPVPSYDVFVVWSCKTLQNSKAILSASIKGAPLFEITMNGDKQEIYVDTYVKKSNEHLNI